MPLTVACVPTGMKAGVSTVPCGVNSLPRRAAVPRSGASISNGTGRTSGVMFIRHVRGPRAFPAAPTPGPSASLVLEFQVELGELLAHFVERGHAEILALHQLV